MSSCQFRAVHVSSGQFRAVQDSSRQFRAVQASSWQFNLIPREAEEREPGKDETYSPDLLFCP